MAASWNRELAKAYGAVIGSEARDLGANLLEGPTVDLARTPLNGRTFEGYGEDPILAGQLAAEVVAGIQAQHVVAEIKHYVANSQQQDQGSLNEVISRRALHELYLVPFEMAVKRAHVGAVMCGAPMINGTYNCENAYLLATVLRKTFGFDGFVGSDFEATHSTVASIDAGLDLEMPAADNFGDSLLEEALGQGVISTRMIDQMLVRRFATMIRLGLFSNPVGTSPISVQADGLFARSAAEQGTVLLKNSRSLLPLDATALKSIAVIGPYAGAAYTGGGGSSRVIPIYTVSPVTGISSRVGTGTQVSYASGVPADLPVVSANYFGDGLRADFFGNTTLSGNPVYSRTDPTVSFDWAGKSPGPGVPATKWSARWTGTLTPPQTATYFFSLSSDDGGRLIVNGQTLVNTWSDHSATPVQAEIALTAGTPVSIEVDYFQDQRNSSLRLGWWAPGLAEPQEIQQAAALAAKSDVAVVIVGDQETEGIDRTTLALPPLQDDLVDAVAAANPRTVVVLNSGGPVLMPWLDRVPAVVEAWYAGEEDGNALAAILFGDVNPSGKLPITFPKSQADLPQRSPEQYPGTNLVATYSEGLKIGYRWYDANAIAPLFPFGFGLSYTTFGLSSLRLERSNVAGNVRVSCAVTNTGTRPGGEVVQVYVADPAAAAEPPKQLAGFVRVYLQPHQSRRVSVSLGRRAFSIWDTRPQGWRIVPGKYTILVGVSSRDVRLRRSIALRGTR